MWPIRCSDRPRSRRAPLRRARVALVLVCIGCTTLAAPEERRIGEEMARSLHAELRFIRDPVVLDYVSAIGNRVAEAAGPHDYPFHFEVVEDDTINAFAAPGGYVYVNTGTILQARNVGELASVLAHEVGHVSLRHVADNYERQIDARKLHRVGVLAASVFGLGGLANLGGGLAAVAVLNSFTREDEREADAFAIAVLPAAGYDPAALLSFLAVVRAEGGRDSTSFFSTHPATQERISEAEQLLAAHPPAEGLATTDGGRFEIIQRRIELLTHKVKPAPIGVDDPGLEPL